MDLDIENIIFRTKPISNWNQIPGWFTFEKAYDDAVKSAKDGDAFVEIGSFLGRSTSYLVEQIHLSGKKISLYVIDPFDNSQPIDSKIDDIFKKYPQYSLFESLMRDLDILDKIQILRMTPIEAFEKLKHIELQFVFLDGSHDFDEVVKQIRLFYPLLTDRGSIAGDDLFCKDVENAVNECFGNKHSNGGQSSWPYWIIDSVTIQSS